MVATIYLSSIALIGLITFIRPIWGIYISTFLLLCNPSIFFSEGIEEYRPIVVLWVIVFISTLLRGYSIEQSRTKFVLLLFLFIFFSAVSLLLAGKIEIYDSKFIANYLKAVLVGFIMLGFLTDKKQLIILFRVSVLGAAGNAIFGVYEQFFPIPVRLAESPAYYRSAGFEGNANGFSALIVSILPLAYYMFTHEEKKYLRYFGLITMFLIIIGVFCSISRGGLVVLTFVLGCIFRKNFKKLPIILLIVIFVGGFVYFAKDLYEKRQTVKTTRSGKVVLDSSTSFRIGLVKSSLALWLYNPIFGVGPGQFVEKGAEDLGVSKRRLSRSIHNAYLHLLVENGLIGFSIFMGIIMLSLKTVGRMKLKGGFYRDTAACMQICVLSWLFSFMGGTEQGIAFVWVCLAFPLVLEKIYFLSMEDKKGF